MQSKSNEHVRETTGFLTKSWRITIAMGSFFDEHEKEVWEKMGES